MFRVYLHIGNDPSFTDVSMSVLPRNGDLLEYRSMEHAEHRGVYRVLMAAHLVRDNSTSTQECHLYLEQTDQSCCFDR